MRFGINTNTNTSASYFSEVKGNEGLMRKLASSSLSSNDLTQRLEAYQKAFSNLDAHTRTFSGTTGLNQLGGLSGIEFVDVTVAAMVKSIVGFIAVERGMEQPRQMLAFLDLVTVGNDETPDPADKTITSKLTPPFAGQTRQGDPDVIARNIGPDMEYDSAGQEWKSKVNSAQHVATFNGSATDEISYLDAKGAFVPGSLAVSIVEYDPATKVVKDSFVITDNGQGELLAPAGRVKEGSVNYRNGALKIKLGAAMTANHQYSIEVAYDTPRKPINRVKDQLGYYELTAFPQSIVAENNLVSNIVAQRSMGIDLKKVLKQRVMETYLKLINKTAVDALKGYRGNTISLDLSGHSIKANGYDQFVYFFQHSLTQVDTELSTRSFKSVRSSAYVVGIRVAELFKLAKITGAFVENKESAYVEDLIGYYNGIPVIQSLHVKPLEGYAIHKTADGLMAPIARGIFLPVNDLPEVGNFNNPTQSASGIFSYEGVKFLTSDLVQKFSVIVPVGFNTIATAAQKTQLQGGNGTWAEAIYGQ